MVKKECQVKTLDILFSIRYITYVAFDPTGEKNVEQIVRLGLLYDFYGELLNEHQKQVYEDLVYNNLSISEIAESYGISRQAASDLIKRINRLLEGYENKLQLVSRFARIKTKISALEGISDTQKEELLKEL